MFAPSIVSPASCPGAAELAAALFSYASPSAPLGASLLSVNRVLMVLAVATFVLVARRFSGSTIGALAVGLGLVASPTIADRLDPRHALALAVAVGVLMVSMRGREGSWRGFGWPAHIWIGATLTAAVLPETTLPMAAIAVWAFMAPGGAGAPSTRERLVRGLLASGALVAVVAATVLAVPDLAPGADTSPLSCVLPNSFATADPVGFARGIALSAGPYVWALLLLGAYTTITGSRSFAIALPLAYAAAPLLVSTWSADSPGALSSPLILMMWIVAAIGMRVVIDACGSRPGGRVAAMIFVLLVPALQLADWRDTLRASTFARGHDRLSLDDMGRHLTAIPTGGAMVAEEALVDILVRVNTGWRGLGTGRQVIARHPGAVRDHARSGAGVHALPLASLDLQNRGVVVTAVPDLPGSHLLEWKGGCVTIGTRWRPMPELQGSSHLALVASTPRERGPAILYAAFSQRPHVQPVDWSLVAMRGFHPMVYDTAIAADVARMDADMRRDNLRFEDFDRDAPFLGRLELFRTPVSPTTLVASLGLAPLRAIAHVPPGQVHENIQVCPAFPGELIGFDGEVLGAATP